MKVSQTIAVSVSSVLFLGMMTLSAGLALAERGDDGGVQLKPSWYSAQPQAKPTIRSVATIGVSTWKPQTSLLPRSLSRPCS